MGIRARIWPGLRTRSIWFDALVALLGTVSIAVGGAAGPTPGSWSPAVAAVAGTLMALALFLFRRSAPLLPFALAAVLTAFSPADAPAVTVGIAITCYAVGRYAARWPMRIAAAVVGALAFVHPWAPGTLNEFVSNLAGVAVVIVLPGMVGVWVRTRALLLAALRERAERAEAERELLARDAVLTERTRIAREMHDAVGHRV